MFHHPAKKPPNNSEKTEGTTHSVHLPREEGKNMNEYGMPELLGTLMMLTPMLVSGLVCEAKERTKKRTKKTIVNRDEKKR